ncbi:hypothetical protein Moror_4105 [Moniliophthora roreri MCA 2997]|uniref:Uncharacterized protein n=2 Tax=Moniliophthora roreri TaxID=221103 RepID=V2XAI8_MONRO|nr:hypothetical protein Moror_4105 [Moniliophthora roreri MCA 2997]KAI3600407.1 hypothetical protein WG66_001704 [Moniliophthora roreri]
MTLYLMKRLYKRVKYNIKSALSRSKAGGKKGGEWLTTRFRPKGPPDKIAGGRAKVVPETKKDPKKPKPKPKPQPPQPKPQPQPEPEPGNGGTSSGKTKK